MSSDDNVYVRHSEMSMLVNEETQTFSVDFAVAECLLNAIMFFCFGVLHFCQHATQYAGKWTIEAGF